MGTTAFVVTTVAVLLAPSLALCGWFLIQVCRGVSGPVGGRVAMLYGVHSGAAVPLPYAVATPLPEVIEYGGVSYALMAAPVDWGEPVEYVALARAPEVPVR